MQQPQIRLTPLLSLDQEAKEKARPPAGLFSRSFKNK
jgi:hypothetical protein